MSSLPPRWELTPAARRPVRGPWLDFLDIEPGRDYRVTIISEKLEGYECHWIKPRTRACVGGHKLCPHCLAEQPRKTYWFAHVEDEATRTQCFVMLTDYSAETLEHEFTKRGTLRGVNCRLNRRNKQKRSPIVVKILDRQNPEYVRIAARPVEPTLRRIWSFPTEIDPSAVEG